MDITDLEKLFQNEDKELWRKTARSGDLYRKRKAKACKSVEEKKCVEVELESQNESKLERTKNALLIW